MVMYDDLGASHTIDLYMAKTGGNSWEVTAFDHADGELQRRLSLFFRAARDTDAQFQLDTAI